LLTLRSGDPKQAIGESGSSAYYHYVRALVFSGPRGDRAKLIASLKELFAKQRPAIMDLAGRSQNALELLDQIDDDARGPARTFKVETLLASPVDVTPQARTAYEILLGAHQWTKPAPLTAKSRANLAIAAWWMNEQTNSANGRDLARALASEVASEWLKNPAEPSINGQLAFSLYHTLLVAHSEAKDAATEQLRVDAAREMIKLASAGSLDETDAQLLYATVMRPLGGVAARIRADGFFADAAGLIEQYRHLNWKLESSSGKPSSVPEKLDELYTNAIEASAGKVGDYFNHRAKARLTRQPPNCAVVLADARELKRFPDLEAQGLALEGNALLFQSRAEKTLAQR
jgi:hypothetical protein